MSEKKKKVLIVDDEPSIRELYTHALEKAGFTALAAQTAEEGLSRATSEHPDFLLLDVRLPGMTGIVLLKKLRQLDDWGKNVPAILLTNVSPETEEMNTAIMETAPSYYLMKDAITPEEVITKINERLASQ